MGFKYPLIYKKLPFGGFFLFVVWFYKCMLKIHFMKYTALLLFVTLSGLTFTSCGDGDGDTTDADSTVLMTDPAMDGTNELVYYDLTSGKQLKKDDASGRYVDDAGSASDFYVDVQARDTFYAPTGQKVNNALTRIDNTWRLDESKVTITDDKIVIQDEDSKLKVKEGKAKLLTDDQKVKVTDRDGDGVNEVKVKDR